MNDENDDAADEAGMEGGAGDEFGCSGRSSSDSVTPLSSSNTILPSFRRRLSLSRRTRPCRDCHHQCSDQWLDGRSYRSDEQQQPQKQYANNTFNIIY